MGGKTMKKFVVSVEEVHIQLVVIEANDEDDASEKVREGDGDYIGDGEYTHTINETGWKVEEINNDIDVVATGNNSLHIRKNRCKYYGRGCQPDSDSVCLKCFNYEKKGMQ
jgi:hypothetical protein